jgi:hypothetical protein
MTQIQQTTTPNNTPVSAEDKRIVNDYVKNLMDRGFCKMDECNSAYTKLYNRISREALHVCFLENDFDNWCHANKVAVSYPGSRYIMRTLKHVVGYKFDPRGGEYSTDPRTDLCYVNTFLRYQPHTTDNVLAPIWGEFWERFIVNRKQRHQALQWLSHLFQKPWERPSWHLMWPSEPGMGKGYLLEKILHPLLIHTETANSYSKVMDKFSTMLETGLLVLLDDCKTTSVATQTRLKSILSEERQYIERKMHQGSMVRSYTRFILASNELRPLYLEADERRWLVFDRLVHKEDRTETQAFISKFDAWLQLPGSLDAIYAWFMNYDISDFNHKNPPASEALQKMVELSINVHEEFTANFAKNNLVFTRKELHFAFDADGLSKPKDTHLPNIILSIGYVSKQLQIDRIRSTYYYPAEWDREEVEQYLQAQRNPCASHVQTNNISNCPF